MSARNFRMLLVGYIVLMLASVFTAPSHSAVPEDVWDSLEFNLRESGLLVFAVIAFLGAAASLPLGVVGLYGLYRFRDYGRHTFLAFVLMSFVVGFLFSVIGSTIVPDLVQFESLSRAEALHSLLGSQRAFLEGVILALVFFGEPRRFFVSNDKMKGNAT